ncbi:uncharacterized protein LOC134454557 [Engraulis encrasicolus]|uniref:uncharacterized protein LOC134454557 n=1 Tax=Engraulis encrasicolus TaxID=184585 RepID=UPI002FD19BEE
MPGCAHDSLVFKSSNLFRKAHLVPQGTRNIDGVDVRLQIVGDPAYPQLSWLMKGHQTSPNLTPQQESFNIYLSAVRVGVEQSFGLLKARFRVLAKRSDFHFTFAPTMIAACCGLHNFCQREGDRCNPNWLEEGIQYVQPAETRNVEVADTSARDALTAYMARRFPLRK